MSDQFQVVSSKGWFARIGESIKGILFGGLMFLGAFPLLWWNEGRAVQTYKSLQEGRGAVVSVAADQVDPANETRLVHLSGAAVPQGTLSDPEFGIAAPAIRLTREAKTYQWVEHSKSETRKKIGGGEETLTTYSYSKDWRENRVDSSRFKQPAGHENPGSLVVESASFQASDVRVGGFQLSDGLIGGIRGAVDVPLTQDTIKGISGSLKGRTRVHGNELYIGRDPASPAVGDARILFRQVPQGDVSVIARQTGSRLGPYQTVAGDELEMIRAGIAPATAMFESAERANTVMTWVARLVGFLAMAFGLLMVLRPIRVLADVVPILGTVVGMGLGLVAFAVAAPLTLVTIALAWVAHRPVLAITLFLIAGVGLGMLAAKMIARRRTAPALSPRSS